MLEIWWALADHLLWAIQVEKTMVGSQRKSARGLRYVWSAEEFSVALHRESKSEHGRSWFPRHEAAIEQNSATLGHAWENENFVSNGTTP